MSVNPGAMRKACETLEPKYKATWQGRTGSETLPTGANDTDGNKMMGKAMTDDAERIAYDLMRKLRSGEIKRLNIDDIRAVCRAEGKADLADLVCRRVVEMVG